MNSRKILSFSKKPSSLANYARIILTRRPGKVYESPLPRLLGRMENITPDPDNLIRYREVCGLKNDGKLPVLYPHVLASPLYMHLLSRKEFPIPLIGSLHLLNHIIRHRLIDDNEPLTLEVITGEKRIVKQGIEFDFIILLKSDGERLWESITTWLKKGNYGTMYSPSPHSEIIKPIYDGKEHAESYIPENIGKRFARITGDYNPIHISRLAAPLFGLKRDVAHAMWVCADTIRQLPRHEKDSPLRIDLAFKGPLFLDSRYLIKLKVQHNRLRFDTYCGDNPRPCIQGQIENLKAKTTLCRNIFFPES